MTELNDKLITYGNLSTFYDKLQEQGLGGNAIEDVQTLPDAGANKNKFVRLASDKKVYVSELVGTSTEEVNAPDAQQINNAHILYAATEQAGGRLISDLVYTGQIYTIVDVDGNESQCYWWKDITNLSDSDTSITQSNITTIDAAWIFSKVNAENCNLTDNIIIFYVEGGEYGISLNGSTITFIDSEIGPGYAQSINQINEQEQPDAYLALQLVKQTVTTETWDWQRVVTEDELNTLDESTFTGATLTVDGSQPSIVASGSTTIVWDDLASSIPSGKTVEVSVVLINTGNSVLTPTMSGNYQMMGDGNITIQPNELGLYRGTYISALSKWLVEAVNQEVSGTVL